MHKVLYDLTQQGWQVRLKQHEGQSLLSKGGSRLVLHWEMRLFEGVNLFDADLLITLEKAGFTPAHKATEAIGNG